DIAHCSTTARLDSAPPLESLKIPRRKGITNAESTLGTGADRARIDRGGGDRRDAAPRAPAHRLRSDVRGADGAQGQGALARAGQPRQPRLGTAELQREPRQPPPDGRASRAGRDPPL